MKDLAQRILVVMKPTEKHYNLVSQREDDEEQGQPHYNGSGRPRLSTILLSSLCLILLISNSVLLVQKGSACSEKTLYGKNQRKCISQHTTVDGL